MPPSSTVDESPQHQEENFMSNAEVLGRFVWHELMTPDTDGAIAFYPKVVPWRTAPSNVPGYTIWMSGQTQVGGLMAQPSDAGDATPRWLVYIGSPDVDATCSRAQGLGARLCKPAVDIPNVGRFAVLADPQGATFAVFTPAPGSPPQAPTPVQGGFSWHELATTDVNAALAFYGGLFAWHKGATHDMGNGMGNYQIIEHHGKQVGGLHTAHGSGSAPAWLSYVQVSDCARAAAAAKSAGGRVVNGPMEVPGGSWIAVVVDPQGGSFAVHEEARAVSQPKAVPTLKAAPPAKVTPTSAKPAAAAPAPKAKAAPATKPARATAPKKRARSGVRKSAPKKKAATPGKAAGKAAKSAPRKSVSRKKVARKATRKKTASRPVRRAKRRRR
jgi:predicted enzyme related to lactoylglutathione lyase